MHITAEQALGLAWVLNTVGQDVLISGGDRTAFNRSNWLCVDYPNLNRYFAIWDTTGAVYECVGELREVPEDPIYVPGSFSKHQANDRLLHMMEKRDDMLMRILKDSGLLLPQGLRADIGLLLRQKPD
jgi:hypothetical protein